MKSLFINLETKVRKLNNKKVIIVLSLMLSELPLTVNIINTTTRLEIENKAL